MKGPWVKLWRNVFADEKIAFVMRRYGHEAGIMWIGILSQAEDGVLLMDEDVFADLVQIEEKRYQELRGILIKRGLVIENEAGLLEVPNWDEYQTGESTDRVRAYRERKKAETLQKRPCNGEERSVTKMERVEGEGEGEGENTLPPPPETAAAVEASPPRKTPPRKSGEDPLYRPVWDSCLSMSGDRFSNYQREGEGCKRFCLQVRARSPDNPEQTAQDLLELFKQLREKGGAFWGGQPFTPSVLASAAIFDRLWTEHQRRAEKSDTSWIDKLEGVSA